MLIYKIIANRQEILLIDKNFAIWQEILWIDKNIAVRQNIAFMQKFDYTQKTSNMDKNWQFLRE